MVKEGMVGKETKFFFLHAGGDFAHKQEWPLRPLWNYLLQNLSIPI
jgi:hypothetical protein